MVPQSDHWTFISSKRILRRDWCSPKAEIKGINGFMVSLTCRKLISASRYASSIASFSSNSIFNRNIFLYIIILDCYIKIQKVRCKTWEIKSLHNIFLHFQCYLQLVIEGVRGSSYVSDIAIDDIAILQGDECIVKNESTSVTVGDDGKFIF